MAELETFPPETARFSQLVAHAGRPSVHLTLIDPRKDRALQRLAGQGRVLSVHRHHRGGGAGYGIVGLAPEPGAQLLIFPKSIKRAAGKRIVGLDFDLLAEQAHVATGPVTRLQPAGKSRKKVPSPPAQARSPAPPPTQPCPPPTLSEIARELAGIARLLGRRKFAAARARVDGLAGRINAVQT